MEETKQVLEDQAVPLAGLPLPALVESEPLTKPCPCGFPYPVSDDGLCGECDTRRQWADEKKQKQGAENEARRNELAQTIGEDAVKNWTFERFTGYDETTAKALKRSQSFNPAINNLYLAGITGSGKSHLSVAIAIRSFDEGKTVYFFPSGPALSRWFRKDMDAANEEKKIRELANADVLIINELGIGRDTEYSIGIAVEVIDARIMRGKNGLVVTSNYHPTDLAQKMGDMRLESRFTGLCEIIEAGRQDYRKLHRKA